MGKKSSSAPPPDPRLVEAQLKSMGMQDSAMQQVMVLATQQQAMNAELQPLQKQQMQFGLDSAKTAYDQSQSDRGWMLGRRNELTGMQDSMVNEAKNFNSDAMGNQRADAAQAGIGKSISDQNAANGRAMASMGIAPDSGRFAARNGADNARAMVGAANDARLGARNEGRMLTDRATNSLAGYPAMAAQTTGQGAQLAASGLGLANMGAGGMNAGYASTAGTTGAGASIAGQMGANASNMWNAQATYKQNADGGSSGWMGQLGGLLGGAASAYSKFSDRRLKTAIVPVGSDERTGLTLYEFAYKAEPDKRFRGVMADEVRKVAPSAVQRGADGFDRVDYAQLGLEMEAA